MTVFDRNMGNYTVYIHTNKINGKRYVGVAKDVKKRWASNYQTCPVFYKALKKYGWDGFTHYILLDGLTLEEADDLERKYIARYKTQDKRYGYNVLPGGHNIGMTGVNHSDKTKRLMSEKAKGRKFTEEHKEKLRRSHLGKKSHCKPVMCLDTGIIYESGQMASKATGAHKNCISKCCMGLQETAKGYRWAFVNKE